MAPDNIRVLLIDDNETDREAIFRYLYDTFCVLEAKSGREGLESAKQSHPACILLDCRLPDIDGFELLARFVDQEIPVVMLTGQGNEELAARAIKFGAQDYLSKSLLTKETLTRAVTNAVEKFRLRKRLEDQQQDIADFVRFVSREIKAPLDQISEAVDVIQQDAAAAPDAIRTISESMARFDALIDAMVHYAQVTELRQLEPVDLEGCVETAEAALQSTGADIQAGRMPIVLGNENGLCEVLTFLMRELIADSVETPAHVLIESALDEELWTITVTNRRRRDEETHSEVSKTSQEDQNSPSTTLGMAACMRIIRHHGGRIWSDKEASGKTFHFTLPAIDS